MSNNNKEQFRLLDLSSDLDSDELHFDITPVKKKRMHRKAKPRLTYQQNGDITSSKGRAVKAVYIIIMAVALFWLLTLTWLTAALHDHITRLDAALQTVTSNGDNLQDLLQKSQAIANEAKANATDVANKLSALTLAHEALKLNVNDAGAKLSSLNSTVRDLKDRLEDLRTAVHGLELSGANATNLELKLTEFNNSLATLGSFKEKMHLLESQVHKYTLKVDSIISDHNTLLTNVTSKPETTQSSTSSPVSSMAVPKVETTSLAPAPPQKPSVTQ